MPSDFWSAGWWFSNTSTWATSTLPYDIPSFDWRDLDDLIEPEEEECKRGFFED